MQSNYSPGTMSPDMPMQQPMPEQGGMMSQPARSSHFNGMINTDEGMVEVVNGLAKIGEDTFYVSDDGQIVTTKEGQIVAVIQDGKAQKLTPEIAEQLRTSGLAQ